MPAGYEKIRDSFIAQGMSEADAKTRAAKIWNKYHKGDEAVGAHYDKKQELGTFGQAFDMSRAEGGSVLLGVSSPKRVEFNSMLAKTGRTFIYEHDLLGAAKKMPGLEHVGDAIDHHFFKVGDSHFKIPKSGTPDELSDLYRQHRGGGILGGMLEQKKTSLVELAAAPGELSKMGDSITEMIKILRKRAKLKAAGVPSTTKLVGDIKMEAVRDLVLLASMPQEEFDAAEKRLLKRLKELNMGRKVSPPSQGLRAMFNSQQRSPMRAPIPTHPTNPRG